jgi:hypothetical protein
MKNYKSVEELLKAADEAIAALESLKKFNERKSP